MATRALGGIVACSICVTVLALVVVTRLGPVSTELQVQQEAPAGTYKQWLEKKGPTMRAAGDQPGSGKDGGYIGKHGLTTNSIEGDSFIDKGWKQMWSAIPAGYKAVKKELQGYMVDGKAEKGNKSEKKATSELSSYANILGTADAWPKKSPEAQSLGKEGKKYDRELESYDDILSFPPAHPMQQKLPQTDTPRKDARIKSAIQQAEAQLHQVDDKLAAASGSPTSSPAVSGNEDKCKECKEKWSSTAMQCAQDTCERKLWSSALQHKQVELNNKLAAILEGCLPQQQGYNTKVVVSSLALPWSQPFSQPAHTWVRAVPAAQAYQGLGLVDGESASLKLGGQHVASGADLICKDGRTLDAHAADLVAPQTELNQESARNYFAALSNTREGARHMADKALESQSVGPVVLSWLFPGGHRLQILKSPLHSDFLQQIY